MVHRGRLSAACGPCRSRRLKCDQRRPFCSQCIRAQRECSGYRDVTAGRFYDQTEEVKRKNLPSSSSPSPSPKEQRLCQSSSLLPQHISVPLNNQGLAFMITRYINRDAPGPRRSHLGIFLPNILNTPAGRAVTASMNAVGLAALSNIHMAPNLMIDARQEYVTALSETNAVLSDQMHSKSDATLVAVMFLGMYELMTCNGAPLMDRYLNHLTGCAELVQLRGSHQLKRSAGLGLFTQFRQIIVLGNFWRKTPTPSWLVELSHEALEYRGEQGRMEDELFLLLAQVGDLCASLRNGTFVPVKILKKALHLDTELHSWAMSTDPSRRYTAVTIPESADKTNDHPPFPHIYGRQYHIYPDTIVSSWWNDYRFARLILLELICWLCEYLARKDEAKGSEYRQTIIHSTALSQRLAEDVCASVPFYLGATEASPNEDWSSPRTGGVTRLIWPLFTASDCAGSSPRMLEWITYCLIRIGHGVGIHQALVMSNLLRSGRHLSWLPELGA